MVVFEDGEVRAADGETGAVEGVDELGFFGAGGLVLDVGAAGLEGLEVGAGGDFAEGVLAGDPDFEVVGFGGGEAHVAGAEEHAAVGEAEGFEYGFGVGGEEFVLGVGVFGGAELDELDLLELMLADHAAGVFAVGAGFGAEAGGVGGEGDGAGAEVDDFVAEDVGDGDFGGGDEPVVGVLELAGGEGAFVVAVEEVFGEFGELADAVEGPGVDHVGREDLDVAVARGVEVDHEVGEGAFEAGAGAEVEDEAGAGDLGGAFEVEDAEGFAKLPVGFGSEVEGGDGAPGFDADVVELGGSGGDGVLREVGEGVEEVAEFEVGGGGGGFELGGAGLEGVGLGRDGGGVAAFALEAAEVCGELVALLLEGFELGDGGAAVGVELGEAGEQGGIGATEAKFFDDERQVRPDKRKIKHTQTILACRGGWMGRVSTAGADRMRAL